MKQEEPFKDNKTWIWQVRLLYGHPAMPIMHNAMRLMLSDAGRDHYMHWASNKKFENTS